MILVLGGTAEARELAAHLDGAGIRVTTSLAGRIANPRLPRGEVRVGGFGGPAALADWLAAHRVAAVVDATHPFAERISASAARACPAAGVPLLRLERPSWSERPGDRWRRVPDLAAAAAVVPRLGRRVLLSTGRQGLAAFAQAGAWFLIDSAAATTRVSIMSSDGDGAQVGQSQRAVSTVKVDMPASLSLLLSR